MLKFPKHTCGESRLSCAECNEPVCPKCMVECPVGNRCRKCAAKTESHVIKVTPWVGVRTFVAAALAAYVFGFGASFLFGGYWSWLITYALGVLVGNLLHKVSGFKLGSIIVSVVVSGILCGTLLNPSTFNLLNAANEIHGEIPSAKTMVRTTEHAKDLKSAYKNTDKDADFDSDSDADSDAGVSPAQAEKMRDTLNTMQFWRLVSIAIFGLGLITPFTGAAPQLSFYPFRR